MSLLSEKKHKSKLCINPRGTLWTNDENKFGQKLLEKMGWAKGKGLGKEEQGCKEPLRVAQIAERKGVGYKENGEEWTKHYDAFEDVLTSLNSMSNPEASESFDAPNLTSLECQSKHSKNRVHYKKFTKGKDLSQYNEDDLACILGSKGASKRKRVKEEKENSKSEEMNEDHGVNTIHGGSLKDYFNKKMEELKKKREEGLLGRGDDEDDTNNHSGKVALGSPIPDLDFEPAKTDFSFNYSLPPERAGVADELKEVKEPVEEEEPEEVREKKKRKKEKKKKREKQRQHQNQEALVDCEKNERPQSPTKTFEERGAKRPRRLNESYAAAVCLDDESKRKKQRKKTEEDPPEEDGMTGKVKKIKKIKSLSELIRRDEPEKDCDSVPLNPGDEPQNGLEPRKKLTSKRSFKDLKTELEDKVKRKLKKKNKCLEVIDEDGTEKSTREQLPQENMDDEDIVQVTIKELNNLKCPISKKINIDMKQLFPGSNLSTIKGYDCV